MDVTSFSGLEDLGIAPDPRAGRSTQLKPPSLRTAAIAQEGTSMQRKRRMLTASRLCLLGIAVSASSFSVFAQCPQDSNCNAVVGTIYASAVTPAVTGNS